MNQGKYPIPHIGHGWTKALIYMKGWDTVPCRLVSNKYSWIKTLEF